MLSVASAARRAAGVLRLAALPDFGLVDVATLMSSVSSTTATRKRDANASAQVACPVHDARRADALPRLSSSVGPRLAVAHGGAHGRADARGPALGRCSVDGARPHGRRLPRPDAR